MDQFVYINERVDIVPVFHAHASERLLCVPWKMKYRGQEIVFTEFGLRHPTTKGKRMIHVFDMSDGRSDYRLEFDAERLIWTLITIIGADHAR